MENEKESYGLKLCPICGGAAHLTHIFYDNSRHLVQCTRCGLRTDVFATSQAAAQAWNVRTGAGQ